MEVSEEMSHTHTYILFVYAEDRRRRIQKSKKKLEQAESLVSCESITLSFDVCVLCL